MSAYARFGLTAQTAACVLFFYVLLLLAFIDLDTMRLPNSLVGLLAIVGLGGLAVTQVSGLPAVPLMPLGEGLFAAPVAFSLIGAFASAGLVALIAVVYARVRGTQGFGMGDIKLLLAMGLYLGPYTFLALFFGSMLAAVYGAVSSRGSTDGMRRRFPFGPFLAVGAVIVTLVGAPLMSWYMHLLAP